MYTKFHRLSTKPFDLIPDPNMIFMSEVHKEAMAILRYGVIDRKSFLLLTGDVGTGKTTLLQNLITSLDTKTHVCFLANPTLSIADFYYYLAAEFKLGDCASNKAKFIITFSEFLKSCRSNNEKVILIIDEAQALPIDIFEELRLLSNQKFSEFGILSIFFVGQPELNNRLSGDRLLPLRQRIGIRFHLMPLSQEDTNQYILFRLRKAGGQRLDIFSPEATQLIHRDSKGIPRLINIICDQALLTAFADGKRQVDVSIIEETIKELHIPGEESPLPLPGNPKPGFLKAFALKIFGRNS